MGDSIFTKIINGDIPSYKIAENENFIAFLDLMPLREGHTLVVPKYEIDYIYDLSDQLLADLMIFSKYVSRKIESKIKCKRIGVAVIGLEVPHAHVHLIPINTVSDMNFNQDKLKFTNEEFKSVADLINETD
jgi:histidine triad (HIT) family protein